MPEAQLGRFMFKMSVGCPSRADEDGSSPVSQIRRRTLWMSTSSRTQRVAMQTACEDVYIDPALRMYMVEIVARTREDPVYSSELLHLVTHKPSRTSRAASAMRGRDFVTPDDVKTVAELAIAHGIILKPEHQIKEPWRPEVIQTILREVPVPTV